MQKEDVRGAADFMGGLKMLIEKLSQIWPFKYAGEKYIMRYMTKQAFVSPIGRRSVEGNPLRYWSDVFSRKDAVLVDIVDDVYLNWPQLITTRPKRNVEESRTPEESDECVGMSKIIDAMEDGGEAEPIDASMDVLMSACDVFAKCAPSIGFNSSAEEVSAYAFCDSVNRRAHWWVGQAILGSDDMVECPRSKQPLQILESMSFREAAMLGAEVMAVSALGIGAMLV
jgi:hypothetical protein